jgi:dTMP kinase
MRSGMFISLEGADGAGKSTIARLLYDHVKAEGLRALYIEKNNPTPLQGYPSYHLGKIRDVLWDYPVDAPLSQLGDDHWLHLIAAWFSAVDHCAIRPALANGTIVLTDGWTLKYLARFSLKGAPYEEDCLKAFRRLTEPDCVLFLDTEPDVAATRKQSIKPSESGQLDGYQGDPRQSFLLYQSRVREQMLNLSTNRFLTIPTRDLSTEQVVERAIAKLRLVLRSHGNGAAAGISSGIEVGGSLAE